jgi:hypothetical protein
MAGKKQAPKQYDELTEEVEAEGWDNTADADPDSPDQAGLRLRDWRDVEKYREMRELRRLVGDEFDFTDVLGEIPVRQRGQANPPPAKPRPAAVVKVAKLAKPDKPIPKPPATHKAPAKPESKPAPRHPTKPKHKAAKPPPKPAAKHAPKAKQKLHKR